MSPSDHDESTLPARVESLLVDWPVQEDPGFEDNNAEAVRARLEEVEAGSTPGELLAPPLPATDDDGTLSADDAAPAAAPESAPRSRPSPPPPDSAPRSLADMARATLAESKKSTEDVSDIARESLSVASQSRPSAPDIAAVLASRSSRPSLPPASAPAPASGPAPAQRRGNGPLVATAVALLGLAAAVAIFVHTQNQPVSQATNATVQETATVAAAPARAAPSAATAAKPDDEKGVLSLAQLPNGKLTASHPAAAASAARPATAKKHVVAPAAKPKALAEKQPGNAQKDKKTPGEKPIAGMKPAEGTTGGGLPDKPTTGQVAVAVGAVLGSARACVAGQDAPSHAVMVFGSNGRVKSVSVSGPAAGTPAAGCIRAALSQARLQPFARSHFSVGTPVRPE